MSRIDIRGSFSRVHVNKVPGTLEVLDPEDDEPLKRAGSRKTDICDGQEFARDNYQQPINSHNGTLEVLGPTENVFVHAAEPASRPGSSACRQGSAGRKCSASAKQISLCTVKRIAPSSNIADYNVADLKNSKKIDPSKARELLTGRPDSSAGRHGSARRKCCASTKQISLCTVKRITPSNNIPDYNVADLKNLKKTDTDPMQKEPVPLNTAEKESTEVHSASIQSCNLTDKPQESSSDDDESDNEATAAPLELLTEFIKAVMDEDYKMAWKLCQMILIYEPENPEAKEFSPLIQKMLQNEEDHTSNDGDSEDTNEDGDSSDTDDSESNSTDTSEASSEDEADN